MGGAVRVALTGLNFDGRLGSATDTALAGLFAGIGRLSSRLGTTMASIVLAGVALLCPSLLRRLGPSRHGLPQPSCSRLEIHGGPGLRRRVRSAACPGLESLGRGKLHRIFGNGPGAGNQET